jgi:hypothetical protein
MRKRKRERERERERETERERDRERERVLLGGVFFVGLWVFESEKVELN